MKNIKIITTILFCLVAFSCKKENNLNNSTPNCIFYQNSPNNTDGLIAEVSLTDKSAVAYFYGPSDNTGQPSDINSIAYKMNGNDTIVNIVLDSQKRPSVMSFSLNGINLNQILKFEYISGDSIVLNVYNYNWTTYTDSLLFQAKGKDGIAVKTYGARITDGNLAATGNTLIIAIAAAALMCAGVAAIPTTIAYFALNFTIGQSALVGVGSTIVLLVGSIGNTQPLSQTNPNAPISPTAVSAIIPNPTGTPTNPGGGSVGTVTDIDGNVYNTIEIGTQTWMVENLKTSRYNDGTAIPTGLSNASWQAATSGAYAIYDNVGSNNTTYGKLYNGYAVYTGKLAPSGWHVPSDDEWQILVHYVDGGGAKAGDALKDTTLWNSPNPGANNSSGFTAIPAGSRNFIGQFEGIGTSGVFWTSSVDVTNTEASWFYGLFNNSRNFYRDITNKQIGYSVRCIKN